MFEFQPVKPEEICRAVERAFRLMEEDLGVKLEIEEGVSMHIATHCGGDVRKSLNTVELCVLSAEPIDPGTRRVTLEYARQLAQKSSMKYDREGDEHYDLLSALQKSIRGSDENAALHYLGRLLAAGGSAVALPAAVGDCL